jgi:uncharacterized protein YceK
MRALATALFVAVLVAGCATVDTAEPSQPSPSGAAPTSQPGSRSLTGTLGGDPGLEGGCAWLDTASGRYEVLYPEGYEVRFDPLRLEGPDGVVARAGDTVTVEGSAGAGLGSICQVGDLFSATAVTGA